MIWPEMCYELNSWAKNNLIFFFNDDFRLKKNLGFDNIPTNYFLNSFRMHGYHLNLSRA